MVKCLRILLAGLLLAAVTSLPAVAQGGAAGSGGETLLHAAEAGKILPSSVFFRGQSASVQSRNSGGVRYEDGYLVLAALVDTSGYSSGVQQKYQAYFITEVPLEIGGHKLAPGIYGVGFLSGNRFIVLDVAANELFTVDSTRDEQLHRPTPLQVAAGPKEHEYRLYGGRQFVTFSRVK